MTEVKLRLSLSMDPESPVNIRVHTCSEWETQTPPPGIPLNRAIKCSLFFVVIGTDPDQPLRSIVTAEEKSIHDPGAGVGFF